MLPKALTPGLRPTLFHNNHSWEGAHPLASLFQGTGALAIFFTGVSCAVLLRRGAARSATIRLFLIWMAYNGYMATLPSLVAILLIIPFRVPRELIEVVLLPVVVTVIGIAWMQAGAWRISAVKADGGVVAKSFAWPLGAVLTLLFMFQVVLRPGIAFFR